VQSSPNVGFGVDYHLLRGLMRFIEMTSRKYTLEDVIPNRGGPNYKCGRYHAQKRFNFFYHLNLSIGKAIL
jgi:hypothetical protein